MNTDHDKAALDRRRKQRARQNETEDERSKRLASMQKHAKERLQVENAQQRYNDACILFIAWSRTYQEL